MSVVFPSLAHEVPAELFDNILLYVKSDWASEAEVKAVSSACSLVCRWWAKQCRRHRFNTLRIDCHARFRVLLELLAFNFDTLPSISTHVQGIRLEPRSDDLPWLHLISLSLFPKLTNPNTTITLNLKFVCIDPTTNWRQIYRGLPRSTPVVCSSMNELNLQGVKFKHGEDLVRLIRRFPKLRGLIVQAEWETASTSARGIPQLRNPRFVVDGTIVGPDENSPAGWFMLARVDTVCPTHSHLAPNKPYRVETETRAQVMSIFRAACQPHDVPHDGISQYSQLCHIGSTSSGSEDTFDTWVQTDVSVHEVGPGFDCGTQNMMLRFRFGPEVPFPRAPHVSAALNHVEIIYNELEFTDESLDPMHKSYTPRSEDGKDRIHPALEFLHASWENVALLSKRLRRVGIEVFVRAQSLEYFRAQHKACGVFFGTPVSIQRLLGHRFSRSWQGVVKPRLGEDWAGKDVECVDFVV